MYPRSILKNAGSSSVTPETDFLNRAQNAAINKSKMQPRSILKNAGSSSIMTTPDTDFVDRAQNKLPTCATINEFEMQPRSKTPDVLDQFQIKQKQARELELALQNFGGMDINMKQNSKSVSTKRMSHEEAQLLRSLAKLKRCTERRQQKEIRRGMQSMSFEAREEGKSKVVVDELEEFLCEERRRGREMRFAEGTDDEMGDVHMSG